VVIAGEAGSGKTTILQWLAVQAAQRSFGVELDEWNKLVPFFIQLRNYASARPLPLPS
jgi:predicted NACHT family NTPase